MKFVYSIAKCLSAFNKFLEYIFLHMAGYRSLFPAQSCRPSEDVAAKQSDISTELHNLIHYVFEVLIISYVVTHLEEKLNTFYWSLLAAVI